MGNRAGKSVGFKRARTWSFSVNRRRIDQRIQPPVLSIALDTYGDYGYTSWEFPEMVTREKSLINDSDGRNYPWYGSSHQVVTINGPIAHTSKYTVTMRDFFHPWYVSLVLAVASCEWNNGHFRWIDLCSRLLS